MLVQKAEKEVSEVKTRIAALESALYRLEKREKPYDTGNISQLRVGKISGIATGKNF